MADFDPTTDWTPPTETEREAIREHFDRGRARAHVAPSPLFAGRDEFVRGVRAELRELRPSPTPLPNLTWAAYGAAGAGKSEVLLQLAAEFSQWVEGDSPVRVVWGNRATLTDPLALGEAIYLADGKDPDEVEDKLARIEYGVSLKVVHAKSTRERRARRPATLLGRVGRAVNRDCRNPTILLLVDEANAELESAAALGLPTFALAMHKGEMAGLKVLPVYGGLGDTLDRLADAGVSRLDEGHGRRMEPLSGRVAGDMCRKALCALANPPDKASVDRWAAAIVDRCDGWPMHLTHCFLAVRQRHRARPDRVFSDRDFDTAMRRSDAKRRDYYELRLSRCPDLKLRHYEAWGRLFEDNPIVVAEDVRDALGISESDAEKMLDKALRAGLVETSGIHRHTSPIPSLARYTAEVGRDHAAGRTRS